MGSEALASAIGAADANAVTGAVRRLRASITARLKQELGLVAGKEDVIANDRKYGYCLREWITVKDAAGAASSAAAADTDADTDDTDDAAAEPDPDTAPGRQRRILAFLEEADGLRGPEIEARLGCSMATVKRDMAALRKAGLVRFVGHARTGQYRLMSRSMA